jgi:hypothetical protein
MLSLDESLKQQSKHGREDSEITDVSVRITTAQPPSNSFMRDSASSLFILRPSYYIVSFTFLY